MQQGNRISAMQAWPSMIFMCDWPEYQQRAKGLADHIRKMAHGFSRPIENGVATSSKSAKGLIESPLDLFNKTDNPDLTALAKWIRGSVRTVVHEVNGKQVPIEKLNVRFNESWFHITNDGGFHDAHVHGNCSWCGIFYLVAGNPETVPADGAKQAGNGVNRFYSPLSVGGMASDYGNAYLRRPYLDVQPINGRMVIFPSFLLHSALPYRGKTDRMIVSFNSQTDMLSV